MVRTLPWGPFILVIASSFHLIIFFIQPWLYVSLSDPDAAAEGFIQGLAKTGAWKRLAWLHPDKNWETAQSYCIVHFGGWCYFAAQVLSIDTAFDSLLGLDDDTTVVKNILLLYATTQKATLLDTGLSNHLCLCCSNEWCLGPHLYVYSETEAWCRIECILLSVCYPSISWSALPAYHRGFSPLKT